MGYELMLLKVPLKYGDGGDLHDIEQVNNNGKTLEEDGGKFKPGVKIVKKIKLKDFFSSFPVECGQYARISGTLCILIR